uniref:PUM-HD domain-containing protein n=1 Tax=Aegilops tauschii subsp. strangulata TaxID=200361 RepID=A0A453KQF5_AEGTS
MLFIRMECPSCKVVWSMSDGQKRIMFCQKSLVAAPILLKIVLGNYIVQYVLKQRNPSYLAIIASHFRSNYVTLSRQRYSSNVVETCLQVFNDRDRSNIVHELIRYHPFRDLVSDEFANYVISRALTTCKVPLRDRLATAILSLQNVNRRHPHCLKMFNTLSELGYRY